MSGGAYNYLFGAIEETYVDRMYDPELDMLMKDLCELLHDLEWWQSGDTQEDDYRDAVKKFKQKWLSGKVTDRIVNVINVDVDKLKRDICGMLGDYYGGI